MREAFSSQQSTEFLLFANRLASSSFMRLRAETPGGSWQRSRIGREFMGSLAQYERHVQMAIESLRQLANGHFACFKSTVHQVVTGSVHAIYVEADPHDINRLANRANSASGELQGLIHLVPREVPECKRLLANTRNWLDESAFRLGRFADRLVLLNDVSWVSNSVDWMLNKAPTLRDINPHIGGLYDWTNNGLSMVNAPKSFLEGAAGTNLLMSRAKDLDPFLPVFDKNGLARAEEIFTSVRSGELAKHTKVVKTIQSVNSFPTARAAPALGVMFGAVDALNNEKPIGQRIAGGASVLGAGMMATGVGAPAGVVITAGAAGYQLWTSRKEVVQGVKDVSRSVKSGVSKFVKGFRTSMRGPGYR